MELFSVFPLLIYFFLNNNKLNWISWQERSRSFLRSYDVEQAYGRRAWEKLKNKSEISDKSINKT